MQAIPRLETERLKLRAVQAGDAEAIFRLYSDPKVTEFAEISTFTNIQQARNMISKFTKWFQHDQGVRWGIFLEDSDELIGVCCFDTYLVKYRSANLGYDLASAHWQKGFATEAVAAIVDYAFEHGLVSKINRIQALTHVGNLASERVLEKLDFQKEGLLRQYAYWDRRYHDMNLYSRLTNR
jgi:ribosomal-protein-alanine N-acetyltransferase